jgi:hypothetical protein
MPTDDLVAIRAKFERFPAAVKGAFLLRGADGLPHQVRLQAARAAELGGGADQPVGIESVVLEVSPTQETFVPFEISTMEMAAGWYQLECELVVDGDLLVTRPGDRFSMPWPRAAVRRGTVTIGRKVSVVALEMLECLGDTTIVSFAADAQPSLRLSVDGRAHPLLAVEFDEESGRGRAIGYPVLRAQQRLAVELKGEPLVEVALP